MTYDNVARNAKVEQLLQINQELAGRIMELEAEKEALTKQVVTRKSYRHDYPELQAEVERLRALVDQ